MHMSSRSLGNKLPDGIPSLFIAAWAAKPYLRLCSCREWRGKKGNCL